MLPIHQKTIYFENQYSEYGYLSNFYKSPFWVDGKIYQTNEHFFQSKKFSGKKIEKDIAEAASPEQAYDLGRKKEFPMRKDWRQVKEEVMYQGLKHKFNQHPELKKKLLQTGDSMLVEHYEFDKYWSDGGDGSGLNRQGHLLMKLREELKQEKKT